jgi:hypothetical protein
MADISQNKIERHLNILRCLANNGRVPQLPEVKGGFKTYDAAMLKAMLLETGGEVTTIVSGDVYKYDLKHKHLGVGVYNVWLEISTGDKQKGDRNA